MKVICISFSQGSGFEIPSMIESAFCGIYISSGDVLPRDSARSIYVHNQVGSCTQLKHITKNGRVPEAQTSFDKDGKWHDMSSPLHECNNDFYTTAREVMNELYPGSAKFVGNYKYVIVNSDVDINLIISKITDKLKQKGYQYTQGPIVRNPYYDDKRNGTSDYPLEGEARVAFQQWRTKGEINNRFFSKATDMEVDRKDLTDAGMANYFGK